MKIFLKRNLSVVLALMMVFTSAMPAFSAPARGKAKNEVKSIINDKNTQSVLFIDLTPFEINYIILHSLTFF